MTTELTQHTFTDSGRTVLIRKISPYLVNELRKAYPAPTPPLQEVDYGDDEKGMEPNAAHPDYQKAVSEYNDMIEHKLRRMVIKRGVSVEITPEIKAEIEELRAFWKEENPDKLIDETDDTVFYVTFICFGSNEDSEELLAAIMQRSQPTREDVELTKVAFRG